MDRANATVLLRGDSNVATQRIKEAFALKNYLLRKRKLARKRYYSRTELRTRDFVQHVFREHNPEADQLVNLGAKGSRTRRCVKRSPGNGKRYGWDGATKSDDRSGCGVVIKEVDKVRWATASEIAVPSANQGSALAARVAGRSLLTEVVDLVGRENFTGKIIDCCI